MLHSSLTANITQQQVNARHSVPKELPVFTGNLATCNWSTTLCGFTDAEDLIRLQKAVNTTTGENLAFCKTKNKITANS